MNFFSEYRYMGIFKLGGGDFFVCKFDVVFKYDDVEIWM